MNNYSIKISRYDKQQLYLEILRLTKGSQEKYKTGTFLQYILGILNYSNEMQGITVKSSIRASKL